MGSGIAQVYLGLGSEVWLMDVDEESAKRSVGVVLAGIGNAIERGFQKGSVEDFESSLHGIWSVNDIPTDIPLVIEAVPEIPSLKVDILGAISGAVSDTTVIATNTSSISINELSNAVTLPERFVGAHFFNPVPASKMVEIVKGTSTSAPTVASTAAWISALGKQAIIVNDSPGFASSRLGVMLGLEAIRMVEEGVAAPEDIDLAMTLGYGHHMGPLRSTDLVGLDVRLAVAEYLTKELGPRFEPPKLMRDMVAAGKLGRKTGEGFFSWS